MNYHPKNSFSMSYASRKVIFPGDGFWGLGFFVTKGGGKAATYLVYAYRRRCHQYAVTMKHSHWLTDGTYLIALLCESTISLPIKSTSFGPITMCSVHKICRTMYTFTSPSPIYDISNIHCAVVQNNPFSVVFLSKTNATHQILEIL